MRAIRNTLLIPTSRSDPANAVRRMLGEVIHIVSTMSVTSMRSGVFAHDNRRHRVCEAVLHER